MRRRHQVNDLFFQVALSRTVVCAKVGLVPWQTMLWFSYTCLCVILWSHYFPYPSWFLFGKKKELEEGCKGDAGFWDRVSCNFSGALWKYFSQVWIICQRNVIAYAHNLHLCNSLMLLEVKKKKKREMVSALHVRNPYDFFRCSPLSMTGPLNWKCEQGSSN